MIIVLRGNAKSTQTCYGIGHRRCYMKSDCVSLKKDYAIQARQQWKKKPLLENFDIAIDLYFSDLRKRDWDNFHKLSMDALNGIVWKDDSQIQSSLVTKNYDKKNPRIEISIFV